MDVGPCPALPKHFRATRSYATHYSYLPTKFPRARSFAFDSIHDRITTQEELFHDCGMPDLLEATLDGYTSTVFAYGQTGSGKSARTRPRTRPRTRARCLLFSSSFLFLHSS